MGRRHEKIAAAAAAEVDVTINIAPCFLRVDFSRVLASSDTTALENHIQVWGLTLNLKQFE